MAEVTQDSYPQPTQVPTDAQGNPTQQAGYVPAQSAIGTFPYANAVNRLGDYEYFTRLFKGDHFDAFNVKIADQRYTKAYQKLRYVMVNFAGLISKVIADFLFSEQPSFTTQEGDQDFLDALIHENNLHTQNYESALSNSYLGDALYKIRVGKRYPTDTESTVIIEDITPSIYFPQVDGFNVRAEPTVKELAWTFKQGDKQYLRKEIHYPQYIENRVFLMENTKILFEVDLASAGIVGVEPIVYTEIDRSMLIHVPNWKTGNRYFGLSDYHDLDKLFYAYNNRMTAVDNILDKHSDPILMVPQGVLDENGKVNKKALGVIEIQEGESQKPEYIVWDASLENAFKEVEKIVENIFMISEISPDVLGMGQGKSDSGRALKLKVMRTIAKAARKKLYYDRALKEVLYTAMLVAKAHNLKVGGKTLKTDAFIPDIEWQDGLPIDNSEQVDIEQKRLDSGNTTVVDSIMRLDGVDEDTAEKKAKKIKDETAIALPTNTPQPFGKPDVSKTGDGGGNLPQK